MKPRSALAGVGALFALAAGLAAFGLGGLYAFSNAWLRRSGEVAHLRTLPVPTDPASIARGTHLAHAVSGCTDCHAADGAGQEVDDQGWWVGRYGGPNLTPAGARVADYTDADWFRAIRHGVGPGGRLLRFCPAQEHATYPLEDVAEIIAWARSLPPVRTADPAVVVGPRLRWQYLRSRLPGLVPYDVIDHDRAPPDQVVPEPTAAYGARLAVACRGCHGPRFAGGPIPGLSPFIPPASNLTDHPTGLGDWTWTDFERALRTGVRPDGRSLDPVMPWQTYGQLSETELRALWAYLQSQPPAPYGQR